MPNPQHLSYLLEKDLVMDPITGPVKAAEHITQLQPFTQFVFQIFAPFPYLGTLLIVMLLDIISGTLVAFVQKKVSSSVSYKGLTKKAVMWLLVGLAITIQRETNGVPIARLVAFFYIANEGLSVLENAGNLGVPLPRALTDALLKVRQYNGEMPIDKPLVIEKKETVYMNGASPSAVAPVPVSIVNPSPIPVIQTPLATVSGADENEIPIATRTAGGIIPPGE